MSSSKEFTPFLEIKIAEKVKKNVIIHYKKDRTEIMAKKFLSDVESAEKGAFAIHSGKYKGVDISFIWKPASAPIMAITLDELSYLGVKNVVYLGTFGALQKDIKQGEVFIVSGAVRREGSSDAYVDRSYPAIPDFKLACELAKTAEKLGIPFKYGVVLTEETYHAVVDRLEEKDEFRFHDYWPKKNVFGVEMECSSLFIAGSIRKVSVASVLICNREYSVVRKRVLGKKLTVEEWKYGREKVYAGLDKGAKIVLETFVSLKKAQQESTL